MATTVEMRNVYSALPSLLSISSHVWIDLDEAADVLYISFRKPQQANDSVMEDNVVYHYDGEQLVGVTIIGARALLAQASDLRKN
ncbi:MAG: DUF2283 domain-containing protein [Chloroflexota bacterium]